MMLRPDLNTASVAVRLKMRRRATAIHPEPFIMS